MVMRLQQDGATSHITLDTLILLQTKFGDHFVSRGTNFSHPAHSSPPDAYCLVNKIIFRDDPPATIAEVREGITCQKNGTTLVSPIGYKISKNATNVALNLMEGV